MATRKETKDKILAKSVNVDGVDFNRGEIEGYSTESKFLKAMEAQPHVFEGDNREAKLKQVYAQVHPPKGAKQ